MILLSTPATWVTSVAKAMVPPAAFVALEDRDDGGDAVRLHAPPESALCRVPRSEPEGDEYGQVSNTPWWVVGEPSDDSPAAALGRSHLSQLGTRRPPRSRSLSTPKIQATSPNQSPVDA